MALVVPLIKRDGVPVTTYVVAVLMTTAGGGVIVAVVVIVTANFAVVVDVV